MSNAALSWAWKQALPPVPKLVLVSMGDCSDDHGVCWPSVPTLARKCCLSSRSVQRILRGLEAQGKVRRDSRFRKDGSQTSNCYILALDEGDENLSGTPDTRDRPPRHYVQGPGDNRVAPRTLIEPSVTPPLPPPASLSPVSVVSPDKPADRSGGDYDHGRELVYPDGLTAAERVEAEKLLEGLFTDLAQHVLDELAGRLEAKSIRTAPLSYLRGLVSRARQGTFTPEIALRIAEQRRRRRQTEAALRHDEVCRKEAVQQAASLTSPARDNPLARRMVAIGERVSRRAKGRDDGASLQQAVPRGASLSRVPGARACRQSAGTPALREALAPPSAGALLQASPGIGAAGSAQWLAAMRTIA
jgi:hypothetical protein